MQITNVLAGQPDPTKLGKRKDATEPLGNDPSKATGQPPASAGQSAALREIFGKYDVSAITPNQFSQLIQRLYDAGAISRQDLQDLSAVRSDLEGARVGPDESVNLLEFYQDKIAKVQRQADPADPSAQQQIGPLARRLDWVQKFATARAQGDSVGLSALV